MEHRGGTNLAMGVREGFLEDRTLKLALKDKKTLAIQKKSERVMQRE